MRNLLLVVLALCLSLTSCNNTPCRQGINLLPMYGQVKKCEGQIETDNRFLKSCDSTYSSRNEACLDMLRFAWRYHANGDNETAMKRFNQAWLLDSLNADVYTGFGELLMDKGEFSESVQYFEKSIQLAPNKSEPYKSLGVAYNFIFDETKDQKDLDKSIEKLKQSLDHDISDASVYAFLTKIYAETNQQDSALRYLSIAEKLNSSLVSQDIKDKILTNK